MSMKGNSLELEPRWSSSFEKVARNWFERLSVSRLFRSSENECTRLSFEYIELANDIEYCDIRAPLWRVPPSIDVALGALQTVFFV